jgi:hypothetical protein
VVSVTSDRPHRSWLRTSAARLIIADVEIHRHAILACHHDAAKIAGIAKAAVTKAPRTIRAAERREDKAR